ncbi:hypothetical protein [Microbacterium karelineae]|uniref:hypothetical protein n=1 Tax=Microbacterium karelineae TaxID=2654283 RepID=UPI0012EAD292|nr:hypothetical protein [Microbacterium karelineae]
MRAVAWLRIVEFAFERVELHLARGSAPSLPISDRAGVVREGTAQNTGFTDAGRVDLVVYSLIRADVAGAHVSGK